MDHSVLVHKIVLRRIPRKKSQRVTIPLPSGLKKSIAFLGTMFFINYLAASCIFFTSAASHDNIKIHPFLLLHSVGRKSIVAIFCLQTDICRSATVLSLLFRGDLFSLIEEDIQEIAIYLHRRTYEFKHLTLTIPYVLDSRKLLLSLSSPSPSSGFSVINR